MARAEGEWHLCAESATCTALFGADTSWYWSSSPYDADYAWGVYFGLGIVGNMSVDGDGNVRCVRSGP